MDQSADQVKELLNTAVADCFKSAGGSFREVCLGVEFGVKYVREHLGLAVTALVLRFDDGSVVVEAAGTSNPAEVPDWKPEGLWCALYALACPRVTPFGSDPLRIKRISLAYKLNPSVEYDAAHESGLPLALDREYNPDKVLAAKK